MCESTGLDGVVYEPVGAAEETSDACELAYEPAGVTEVPEDTRELVPCALTREDTSGAIVLAAVTRASARRAAQAERSASPPRGAPQLRRSGRRATPTTSAAAPQGPSRDVLQGPSRSTGPRHLGDGIPSSNTVFSALSDADRSRSSSSTGSKPSASITSGSTSASKCGGSHTYPHSALHCQSFSGKSTAHS
jgi:hypothetical protein